jgi:hypothetical protein
MEGLLLFPSAPPLLLRMEIGTSVRLAANALGCAPAPPNKLLYEEIGPAQRTQNNEKEKNMNDQNRVLVRKGARDLNNQEVAMVSGGLRTLTACTLAAAGTLDGDTFHSECGSPDQ